MISDDNYFDCSGVLPEHPAAVLVAAPRGERCQHDRRYYPCPEEITLTDHSMLFPDELPGSQLHRDALRSGLTYSLCNICRNDRLCPCAQQHYGRIRFQLI